MFGSPGTSYKTLILFLITILALIPTLYPISELSSLVDSSKNTSHKISIVGTISSKHDPSQNTGLEQSYYIFPLSNINETYSGILSFTSSKPVQVQTINILTLNNSLKLPVQFGTLYTSAVNNTVIIASNILDEPRNAGSIQFSSNTIRFIANEPFLVTYSFSGEQFESTIKNNIESGLDIYRQIVGTRS
ncbi:MAG TPA: hypothetical protein VFG45_13830 [Candidatus Nitrosocosmicus sp.]|nr:hypothetical protein [Candidatus Nitrosocosmicus sp.]